MDLLTLVISIILCAIGIILALRIIKFVLRILSVALLLFAIIAVVGFYFSAQAYILPPAHSSYLTLTQDGGFVINQKSAQQFEFDATATAVYEREFVKPIHEVNTSTYKNLKKFSRGDIFDSSDTVWLVNAINTSSCNQEIIIKNPKLFVKLCSGKGNFQINETNLIDKIDTTSDITKVNKIPLKSSFYQWIKNYFFDRASNKLN